MSSSAEWQKIIDARKHDANEATRLIYEQYGNRVLGLIRQQVGEQLQQRVDPDDIANDVWHSFVRRQDAFVLDNRHAFLGLLLTLATRKVARAARKNDDRLPQQELDSIAAAIDQLKLPESIHRNYITQPAPESTPDSYYKEGRIADSFFADGDLRLICHGWFRDPDRPDHVDGAAASIAIEMVESLPENTREIAMLKLEGYSNSEIATQIGKSPRSVDRRVAAIRDAWKHYLPQTGDCS